MKPVQTFTEILKNSIQVGQFLEKLKDLNQLQQYLMKRLDPRLSPHCKVSKLKNQVLTLVVSSPSFGHQLRFSEPEILSIVRSHPKWQTVKAVHIQVQPEERPSPPPFPAPKLSPQAARQIQITAESLPDSALRSALLRLAGAL